MAKAKTAVASAVQTTFHVAQVECFAAWFDNTAERSMIALAALESIQALRANTTPEEYASIVRMEYGSIGVAANKSGHVVGQLTQALCAMGYTTQRGPKRKDGEETPGESRAVDMFAARNRSIAYAAMSSKFDVASFESFNKAYEAAKLIVGNKRKEKAKKDDAITAPTKITADVLTKWIKEDETAALKMLAKALRNAKETLKASVVDAWINAA